MTNFIYHKEAWIRNGISFGSAMSIAISFSINKSVIWAIFHGMLSWVYVIYYIVVY